MNDMEQVTHTYILQLVIESPVVIEREEEWKKLFLKKPKIAGLKQAEVVLVADEEMAEKIATLGVREAVSRIPRKEHRVVDDAGVDLDTGKFVG
jgi:hypothetical protein